MNAIIKLPKCWARLIDIEFDGTETSEKNQKGIDDPAPHYDDVRVVSVTFPDGMVADVGLFSGQSNYFGAWSLVSPDGEELFNEVIENYNGLENEINDTKYALTIEWV